MSNIIFDESYIMIPRSIFNKLSNYESIGFYAELKSIMFNNNTYYTKENIKNEIIKQRDISNYKFNLLWKDLQSNGYIVKKQERLNNKTYHFTYVLVSEKED